MLKFNQSQKKAIAQNLDNIGTAVVIAILVGIFVDAKLTMLNAFLLAALGLTCYGVAIYLRTGDDGQTKH